MSATTRIQTKMKFIAISGSTSCESFENITSYGDQGEYAMEAAELLEFEQEEDDMDSVCDIMQDEEGKLYACRFDDVSCVEYIEVANATIIKLNEDSFRDLLQDAFKTAHNFHCTGWRIPIYCTLDDIFEEGKILEPDLSQGGWLSTNSYQPDALEVYNKVKTWNCADWQEAGYESEDEQISVELDEMLDNSDWKDEIEQSITEYIEQKELELPFEIEWV